LIEHRAEIAHVEPAAARFALPKMFGFGQRRSTGHLADYFPRGISRSRISASYPIQKMKYSIKK
jgi:hypothetical protein